MSNITLKQIQDAEAFLNEHSAKILKKDYNYITCTMQNKINSLDELGEYDTNNMIELINSTIHFKTMSKALREVQGFLKSEITIEEENED